MSSFGGSVKLTGESEYQKALRGISDNLKVLNSEMKTVTSQYDKNDKSVENLSSQNDVLNKKIEEQEKKVSILKDALAKAKEETGDNSDTTKKWQTELNNAQADLNKLNRDLDTNKKTMAEAVQETKQEADAVEDFGEEAEKSGEKALSMGDIIKANLISDAIKGGLTALVDGIKAVGSAMGEALTEGAAYADTFLTLSVQTGLSTDTLEKYNAVAELADVSVETFTGSLAKTTKAMGEAQKGSAKYVEAYEQLGVSVTDANGNLRDSEDVYWETVDALKGIENETERDALAMELFGKKAQDLNTIIEMGSDGFKELEGTATGMGAVLGGDALASLGALDDQMQMFSTSTTSTKNILASAFAPAMTSALGGVNKLTGSVNGLISAIISGEGIDDALYLVGEGVDFLFEGLEEALPQVMEMANHLIEVLLQSFQEQLPWIIEWGGELLGSLLDGIGNALPQIFPVVLSVIQTLVSTLVQQLPTLIDMGMKMLMSLIEGIAGMLPQILQSGMLMIHYLLEGITKMIPDLIPIIISTVVLLVETLLDNIDLIIDAGIELIMALADGLLEALPDLIDKIPDIIDKVIEAITDNLPKLLEAGIELTVKLAAGLIQAIPQLVEKIPEIISSLVEGFVDCLDDIAEIGGNIVEGIWNGISSGYQWIKGKIEGWVGNVLDFFKSLLGIHSPSTVFKEQIGENLALGVGEGFTDTMSDVTKEMADAIPTEFDADISTNLNAVSGSSQMSTYDMMVSAFTEALTNVKVVMDDREMGGFVTNTIEKVVYA